MKYTIFEIYEAIITEAHRHFMNNNFNYHSKRSRYKKHFFKWNPDATEEDYYSWVSHYQCENWEDDIIWMTDEQFKYHWPIHYSYINITRIHSEEESNRNGPPSDQG